MKTPTTQFFYRGREIFFIVFVASLSSCYSVKPHFEKSEIKQDDISTKFNPKERYVLKLTNGQTLQIRVDSVMADKLTGDATVRINGKSNYHKSYTVFYDQIESSKKLRHSAGKTVAAATISSAIFVFILIKYVDDSFSFSAPL